MLGNVKRPYRKLYQPEPIAHVVDRDSSYIVGEPIKPNTPVLVVAHYGPFRRIRDDAGNEMSVGNTSLKPAK